MADFVTNFVAMATGVGHGRIHRYTLLFSPWKWFQWIPWPQDRSRWSYVGQKDAAAILDAILNYTFLPHIWNVYPSFFQSPMGPLQGSRVKIMGHIIAHRTFLSTRTTTQ